MQVDIPNNMDDEWTLDIKKSQATPPKTIRDAMKRYVEKLAAPSRRTQQFRGRKTSNDPEARIWTSSVTGTALFDMRSTRTIHM